VGHEGPGSLHSYLTHKGWITSLNASPQDPARGFGMFKVMIRLTSEGFRGFNFKLLDALTLTNEYS
jgi:insulysin